MVASMNDCPVEILEHIVSFCDDKSKLKLNQVSTVFYHITKKTKTDIEDKLVYFKLSNESGIIIYIIMNHFNEFKLLCDLDLFDPHKPVFYTREMCNWDGYETVGNKQIIDICIRYNRIDMIKQLIKYGIDFNKRNEDGVTPLMKAVCMYRSCDITYEMIDLLCENGADPNVENNYGYIAMDMINSNYCLFVRSEFKNMLRDYGSREGTVSDEDDWGYDEY